MVVVDIADPASPQVVGRSDTWGSARKVALLGSYAYVADFDWGLQVVDIADPLNPTMMERIDTEGYAGGVAASGHHVFLASSDFLVFDVSDPFNAVLVADMELPADISDVFVSGSYAYVTDAIYGVQVIDITDPANPLIVGNVSAMGSVLGVAITGSYLYVAGDVAALAGNASLLILPAQCDAVSAVVSDGLPSVSRLLGAVPNPFNPQTTISFDLPHQANVSLRIYDLTGRLVRTLLSNKVAGSGRNNVVWQGRDEAGRQVSSGVYFCRLEAGRYSESMRMVLVR